MGDKINKRASTDAVGSPDPSIQQGQATPSATEAEIARASASELVIEQTGVMEIKEIIEKTKTDLGEERKKVARLEQELSNKHKELSALQSTVQTSAEDTAVSQQCSSTAKEEIATVEQKIKVHQAKLSKLKTPLMEAEAIMELLKWKIASLKEDIKKKAPSGKKSEKQRERELAKQKQEKQDIAVLDKIGTVMDKNGAVNLNRINNFMHLITIAEKERLFCLVPEDGLIYVHQPLTSNISIQAILKQQAYVSKNTVAERIEYFNRVSQWSKRNDTPNDLEWKVAEWTHYAEKAKEELRAMQKKKEERERLGQPSAAETSLVKAENEVEGAKLMLEKLWEVFKSLTDSPPTEGSKNPSRTFVDELKAIVKTLDEEKASLNAEKSKLMTELAGGRK